MVKKKAGKASVRKLSSNISEEEKEEIEEEDDLPCWSVSQFILKVDILIELPTREKELI